jgi:hypothetical protein
VLKTSFTMHNPFCQVQVRKPCLHGSMQLAHLHIGHCTHRSAACLARQASHKIRVSLRMLTMYRLECSPHASCASRLANNDGTERAPMYDETCSS